MRTSTNARKFAIGTRGYVGSIVEEAALWVVGEDGSCAWCLLPQRVPLFKKLRSPKDRAVVDTVALITYGD